MAIRTEALSAGGPARPAHPIVVSARHTARRILVDRWASRLVVLGGIVIIGAILAILLVIVAEVYPLFRSPVAERLAVPAAASGAPAAGESAGIDEYREVAYLITEKGSVDFVPLAAGRRLQSVAVPALAGARVTSVAQPERGRHVLGTSDGRLIPLEIKFEVTYDRGVRTVALQPVFAEAVQLDPQRRSVRRLAAAAPTAGSLTVAQVGPTELILQAAIQRKALVGASHTEESRKRLTVSAEGEVTALALDGRGEELFVGTSQGQVLRYDLRDPAAPVAAEAMTLGGGTSVTMLGFLIGDRTLIVGDGGGRVMTLQVVPPRDGGAPRLTFIREFPRHDGAVVTVAASRRDKGFVTADSGGGVHVSYGTSGRTLLELAAPTSDVRGVVFAPKADGLLALGGEGRLAHWRLDNPHPEVTLATLFNAVWYEGYPKPEYVWQSTGGTDDFESKLSLTPLVFGTLKGTFYALLIAVPLALLAALYVSEFMHPTLKGYVKPVVEIMAALPSVVLGFLAGLWLAPLVERVVPGLVLLPPVLAVAIVTTLMLWRRMPAGLRRARPGTEALVLVPVVLGAGWLAVQLGALLEAWLLGGDYRGWLLTALGLTYDQRNSLVVGVAMGFAVIPIIFTIAEDSLANVPQHLRAGSLALGATRWQTALRIVLPTASPGIFSAIMIGFGRAVGETMIVLMATGNTPVMDWSIFSGFRALSANIAVELPEAPESGTLFRVLFLAALLLFCLTFLVNTAAELVRLRLRRRYRYL